MEVTLEEFFAASPERVFAAWTDPALVGQWFGCGPGRLWTVHVWECRTGGALRVSMEMNGQRFEVDGEFYEVTPAERIRYRFGTETVEVEFRPENKRTNLRLTHRRIPTAEDCGIRKGGWTYCLRTSLEGFLEGHA
ncbi:MAG: SRPBCC family protein [Myxococcota bacterium]